MADGSAWLYGLFGVPWSIHYIQSFQVMQTILVILAILGAGFYLVRRFVLTSKRKKQAGCEKCGMKEIEL